MVRAQISWKCARSPRSRNGELASVCSTASEGLTSPSTESESARTVSCMPRSMMSRRSRTSWRTMMAANSSSGSTAAPTSTMRCERSLTSDNLPRFPGRIYATAYHPSVGGGHERLERAPYLVARRDDGANRAVQKTERLRRWAARQSAARVPAQALRGDRLPAADGPRLQRRDLAGGRRCVRDAGDRDRRGLQSRLLQGKARQGPADAQPRHQRDVYPVDRPLALRMERGRREAARRPRP